MGDALTQHEYRPSKHGAAEQLRHAVGRVQQAQLHRRRVQSRPCDSGVGRAVGTSGAAYR